MTRCVPLTRATGRAVLQEQMEQEAMKSAAHGHSVSAEEMAEIKRKEALRANRLAGRRYGDEDDASEHGAGKIQQGLHGGTADDASEHDARKIESGLYTVTAAKQAAKFIRVSSGKRVKRAREQPVNVKKCTGRVLDTRPLHVFCSLCLTLAHDLCTM